MKEIELFLRKELTDLCEVEDYINELNQIKESLINKKNNDWYKKISNSWYKHRVGIVFINSVQETRFCGEKRRYYYEPIVEFGLGNNLEFCCPETQKEFEEDFTKIESEDLVKELDAIKNSYNELKYLFNIKTPD